jgi:hypothetical protein
MCLDVQIRRLGTRYVPSISMYGNDNCDALSICDATYLHLAKLRGTVSLIPSGKKYSIDCIHIGLVLAQGDQMRLLKNE